MPRDSNILEAWDISSGEKAWSCELPGKIVSAISVSDGLLGVLTTEDAQAGYPWDEDFRPQFVLIESQKGDIVRTMETDLCLWPRDTTELAHLPDWFLVIHGNGIYGLPKNAQEKPYKWKCWRAKILGVPVALPERCSYLYCEQLDYRRIITYPKLPFGRVTLFTADQ